MNTAWIKSFPIVLATLLFLGCSNPTGNKASSDKDPIFQSDPKLKKITDQINKSPTNAGLFFERGNLLYKMQLDSLALKDYKTASSLDTANAEYYSAVGTVLFEHKDLTGAVEWIQKAIKHNPDDRKAHLKIAKLFLYIKDYKRAFEEINVALRANVYEPEAYFLKGMVYKNMGDTTKAISSFLTTLNVSPDYRPAIMQLAGLYAAKKDSVALRYYDNAFRLDSTDVKPLFAKGVYYQQSKDYVAAKAEYKRCILRNRHFADAYFNLGVILLDQDSVQKAYRQYDLVAIIDPRNSTAYFNRGLCAEIMDSMSNAIRDYRIAVRLDSSYQSPKEALKRLKVPLEQQ
jgi:tetratricopeptide (TPR) repeat protein